MGYGDSQVGVGDLMARDYLADCRKAKDEGLISSDLTFTKLQVMLGTR